MKISIERDALFAQLQTVTRVASTRSAIQALSGVQLTATGSVCELRATDADVSLRVPLEAEIAREGTVVLPARLLLDVVRSLPSSSGVLELRPAEHDVELTSGNATFDIRTLHAEDFPPFPEPDLDAAVSVPARAFIDTALKVAGSASRDETRPVLTGIHVAASGTQIRMVATDSYRLSVKETALDASLASGFEVQRSGEGITGALSGCRSRRGRDAQRQRPPEPDRVRVRRGGSLVEVDRRAVPQRSATPSRDLRARASDLGL